MTRTYLRGFESIILTQYSTVPFEVIDAEALVAFLAAKAVRMEHLLQLFL